MKLDIYRDTLYHLLKSFNYMQREYIMSIVLDSVLILTVVVAFGARFYCAMLSK